MRNRKKPEILAPAGSMDALRAAVYAGADAVYLGGNRFGARAFADNFDENALLEAIQYAHIYGVKVYLTINTLFRDEEIKSLYDYLLPLYEAGLDAVIVQDLGVVSYVHETFPDLPIHASTQMTVTTQYAYTVLKDYGVTRIVPARELSVKEIARLKTTPAEQLSAGNLFKHESLSAKAWEPVPEVEVFVQGALCYCYSGQCLMSSMLGGRSGNRGRCAQTCRLAFDAADAGAKQLHADGGHILSLKDLCGLESIPDLIRAGVDSFKIEGRMKKPEYVAVCVKAYRICLDAWFDGKLTKEMINQQKQEMAEVFNRGGFTDGYYQKHNGKDMITVQSPGNVGVEVGNIQAINRNRTTVKLSKEVFHGDILVIGSKEDSVTLTCNTDGNTGMEIVLNTPHSKILKKGMAVNRMQNAKLMSELSRYISEERKIPVSGKLILKAGEPAQLSLVACMKGETYTVTVKGEQVQTAEKNPLCEDVIQKKITATGNTRYQFQKMEVWMEEGIFYPSGLLKELRRTGLCSLEKEICRKSLRVYPEEKRQHMEKAKVLESKGRRKVQRSGGDDGETLCIQKKSGCSMEEKRDVTLMVSSAEQYETIVDLFHDKILRKNFTDIYLDLQYFKKEDIIDCVNRNKDIHHFLVLPPVLREESMAESISLLQMMLADEISFFGIVVRNLDELALLKWVGYQGFVITDYSLYAMNGWAVRWIANQHAAITVTLPVELNARELLKVSEEMCHAQWVVYGHQQLMISAQCVLNTIRGCEKSDSTLLLKDRYNKTFFVKCICKYCYNLLYNGAPTVLFDVGADILKERVTQRLHFTVESREQTKEVIDTFLSEGSYKGEKTRGHYKRGVE